MSDILMNEAVAWELISLDNALFVRDNHHSVEARDRAAADVERKLKGRHADVVRVVIDLYEKGLAQRTFNGAREYLDNLETRK